MDHQLYLEKLKASINILSDILDTENYGMCIVDREGRIVQWNYERFFHLKEGDVLGLPVTQVLENTRLHIVAQTGKKELFQLQKINGNNVIANRIPGWKKWKTASMPTEARLPACTVPNIPLTTSIQ